MFSQAKDVLKLITDKRGPIDDMEQKVIGKTRVLIDGDSKNCRRQECNMGNLICDAMLDYVRFFIILIDVFLVVDVARIFLENNGNNEPVFSLLRSMPENTGTRTDGRMLPSRSKTAAASERPSPEQEMIK